jgi:hypothetical protein
MFVLRVVLISFFWCPKEAITLPFHVVYLFKKPCRKKGLHCLGDINPTSVSKFKFLLPTETEFILHGTDTSSLKWIKKSKVTP